MDWLIGIFLGANWFLAENKSSKLEKQLEEVKLAATMIDQERMKKIADMEKENLRLEYNKNLQILENKLNEIVKQLESR